MTGEWLARARARLFAPVDIASLAVFRIAFGLILLWQVARYLSRDLIRRYWIDPEFNFTYPGFGWVSPWPGDGMYWHMGALAVCAALIAAGAFYRVAMALFCLGFTYTFLLEQARYLNHFYFVCLLSFVMIFVPAHRAWSFDAWRRPKLRSSTVPFWPVFLLRAQLAIVYTYAGVAKMNADWIAGEPVRSWLRRKQDAAFVGPLFEQPETFYLIAWGGLAFDLLAAPFLLWRRTRAVTFALAIAFHLLNAWFFNIGIFPWFSIAMTTLFFEPDWPRRLFRRLAGRAAAAPVPSSMAIAALPPERRQRRIFALLAVYLALQILIPLRHWLYPGDVAWTEEGHQFSWRMKLRSKSGDVAFRVTNPATGESWLESPELHLRDWQVKAMRGRPEMIRQYAHYLAEHYQKEIGAAVEVRAYSGVKLNARPIKPLIDWKVDLASEPYRIGPSHWITTAPPSS